MTQIALQESRPMTTTPSSVRMSPRVLALPRYETGLTTADVLRRFGLDAAVKLSSNESAEPPLPEVVEAIQAAIPGLNRYPDPAGRLLRTALAERHGLDDDQVTLGNGSCELILLLGHALLDAGTTVVHADPSFAIYPHLALGSGAEAVAVPLDDDGGHDLDAMAAAVDERTRLVVVCNPNNPTGVYRSADALTAFVDALPEDLAVLIDEAYVDFVSEPDSGRMLSLARRRPNVLVTRTFSKAYGLCGLRIGYAVGARDIIQAIDRVRQPFNTNALAQVAAVAALRRSGAIVERARATIQERERVCAALLAAGEAFTSTQTNFILMRAGSGEPGAASSAHELLLRRGVIVRDGAALGCAGHLRVSIGTPDENDRFLAALADVRSLAPEPTTPGLGRVPS